MEDIKVSIITVCFNSERTIDRTIKSVLDQTYKNIEYIIIDGASTDRTLEVVDSYKDQFEDRLKVISEKDDGIYYAMNKGIDISTGILIGIINSDDWYEADAVQKMVDAYEENHKNHLTVYYGNTGVIQGKELISISKPDHKKLEDDMISHPSCFVTKEAYEEMGTYDTYYPSVADYDLMLRYKRSGKVDFIHVDEHIANFTLGGMSSTGKAYVDLIRLKINYKKISCMKGYIDIAKARLAMYTEVHGIKYIKIRKG